MTDTYTGGAVHVHECPVCGNREDECGEGWAYDRDDCAAPDVLACDGCLREARHERASGTVAVIAGSGQRGGQMTVDGAVRLFRDGVRLDALVGGLGSYIDTRLASILLRFTPGQMAEYMRRTTD